MELSCKIVEDLLPLYLDGSCSEDSRAALEGHLKGCPSCRAKLERMGREIPGGVHAGRSAPQLASYAKKVRGHRMRVAVLAAAVTVAASAVLALGGLAVRDMYQRAHPAVMEVEEGTHNLTASVLETTAEEAGGYILFTNDTEIKVTVGAEGGFHGTVKLWNAEDGRGFIQVHEVDEKADSCTFTGLSAAKRYRVTCDGLDGAAVIVSEGRTISFWNSLRAVVSELLGAALGG